MAEPKRQRRKIQHTIAESLIPEQGTFGDVWLAKDTGSIWFTARNGIVFCLSDVLDGVATGNLAHAAIEVVERFVSKGIVQAEHGRAMRMRLEALARGATHALRRRVGDHERGMRRFLSQARGLKT